MTDQQKQTIHGMRQLGRPYADIAETLGISVNTIKSFCRRNNLNIHNASHDGCKNCGAPLQQQAGTKQRIFCSDKCRYAWWNRHRKYMAHTKVYHLICLNCGNEFKSYGNKNRKYCGRECYIHSRYGEGLP